MSAMFNKCTALKSIKGLSNFDTEDVEYMAGMFEGCSELTSLDLSSFNTSSAISMKFMFDGCSGLKTIYVGDKWSTENVTDSGNGMFNSCTFLVGGKGTKCDGKNNVDATYARIDGGVDNPGYLTYKKYGADKTAIQGDGVTWTLGSSDALVLTCGGEKADCTSICVSRDDATMQLYDGRDELVDGVTVTEGSTVLTFQPAALEKFSAGTYEVTFSYDEEKYDPSTATARFTVAAAAEPTAADESAKTGDATTLAFAGLAAAAAAAAGLALAASRRRRDL